MELKVGIAFGVWIVKSDFSSCTGCELFKSNENSLDKDFNLKY